MAPEKNLKQQKDFKDFAKIDIYSFGATLYYMLFKTIPLDFNNQVDHEKSDEK